MLSIFCSGTQWLGLKSSKVENVFDIQLNIGSLCVKCVCEMPWFASMYVHMPQDCWCIVYHHFFLVTSHTPSWHTTNSNFKSMTSSVPSTRLIIFVCCCYFSCVVYEYLDNVFFECRRWKKCGDNYKRAMFEQFPTPAFGSLSWKKKKKNRALSKAYQFAQANCTLKCWGSFNELRIRRFCSRLTDSPTTKLPQAYSQKIQLKSDANRTENFVSSRLVNKLKVNLFKYFLLNVIYDFSKILIQAFLG